MQSVHAVPANSPVEMPIAAPAGVVRGQSHCHDDSRDDPRYREKLGEDKRRNHVVDMKEV